MVPIIHQFDEESGVPVLSKRAIWDFAGKIIDDYFPHLRVIPAPFPWQEFMDILNTLDSLKLGLVECGTLEGHKVCGYTDFDSKTVVLDPVFLSERPRSATFLFAHEAGHWLLHRHRPLVLGKASDYARRVHDRDSFESKHRRSHGMSTPREWIEWQANCFANALILPEEACRKQLLEIHERIGVFRNRGMIFWNDSRPGEMESLQQLEEMARHFDVSRETMKIRLQDLKLMVVQAGVEQERDVFADRWNMERD